MQLIYNPQTDVYVLDDSFNGNLQGIESIIRLLREAPLERRKIVVAG
jgi:UDP-N-acetylmuramyl pentapeptide synthase